MSRRAAVFMRWEVWQGCPQDEWRTWLRRHGLDPARIPVGASIAVVEPDHRIEVSVYDHPEIDSAPHFWVVQCESRVMPWPDIGGRQPADPFAEPALTLG